MLALSDYKFWDVGATTPTTTQEIFMFLNGEGFDSQLALGNIRGFDTAAEAAPVPEPGTMMLLGAGFLGLAVYSKRRKNA